MFKDLPRIMTLGGFQTNLLLKLSTSHLTNAHYLLSDNQSMTAQLQNANNHNTKRRNPEKTPQAQTGKKAQPKLPAKLSKSVQKKN